MNENNFLSFLQQLLTMTNPEDEHAVLLAKSALHSIVELAVSSRKVNGRTARLMTAAEKQFHVLLRYRDLLAGIPGDFHVNEYKRERIADILFPHC